MFKKGFLNSLTNRFKADTRGNVAIIFGVATVPLMIAAGCAVDIARAHIVQNRLQAALDAGAMAAATTPGLTEEERVKMGETVFAANYPTEKLGTPSTPVFDIDKEKVVASIDAEPEDHAHERGRHREAGRFHLRRDHHSFAEGRRDRHGARLFRVDELQGQVSGDA